NGNTTNAEPCNPSIPETLCLGNSSTVLFDSSGRAVPDFLGNAIPGQNDNSSITSLGLGASLQGSYRATLLGHDNHLVAGVSLDHGSVRFNSTNELGIIDPQSLVVSGTGII